jgi:hypothetical protein
MHPLRDKIKSLPNETYSKGKSFFLDYRAYRMKTNVMGHDECKG